MTQTSNPIIRRLQVVFAISILLLIVSSFASYYSIRKLVDRSNWVNHTFIVMSTNQNLILHIRDAETTQRGYLITHNETFLPVYQNSVDSAYMDWKEMKNRTLDNPAQQQNLDTFKRIMDDRMAHLQKLLDQDKVKAATQAVKDSAVLTGTGLMRDLRRQSEKINDEEERLLAIRTADQNRFSTYTPILILIASFLSILITIASYFRIKSDLDARIKLQEDVERKYRETSERITVIEGVTRQIAGGDYTVRSGDHTDDDLGRISRALNEMVWSLQKNFTEISDRSWVQSGTVQITEAMRGQVDIADLSAIIIENLSKYVDAQTGALYIINETSDYLLRGQYAAIQAPLMLTEGEGQAGQAIKDKQVKVLNNLPGSYLSISSALGKTASAHVILVPLAYADKVNGFIELGFLQQPSALILMLVEAIRESMAIAINSAINFKKLQTLLEQTQAQSEELQAQHRELENMNAELEAQTQKLQASEEELRVQQEELLQTNQELEERSLLLEEKSQLIYERNIEIQKKAEQLALSTKYKSEFLANMSHELRTPLNSILLLSRLLSENGEKNLTDEQVEYAQVVQASGGSLLNLIDEILDLSKIESGKMDIEPKPVYVQGLIDNMKQLFTPVAKEKGISFDISPDKNTPEYIETDQARLEQIIKNLLSNAMKFTGHGGVSLDISQSAENSIMSFCVKDSGIGIAADKQELIFEAFQQADGSTRRKFGGTGLGLSISRELAKLLGGAISVNSTPDVGSEFTLTLPVKYDKAKTEEKNKEDFVPAQAEMQTSAMPGKKHYLSDNIPEPVADDRSHIAVGDKVILIVEDDTKFATALLNYTRRHGYKGIVAVQGDEGIQLAEKFIPMAILLDIQLPVKDGWQVMQEIKNKPATRHIPVHIMSSYQMRKESMLSGAVDFINKPIAFDQMPEIFSKLENVIKKKDKKVLIIEENDKHAQALSYFLQSYNVAAAIKSSVNESIRALQKDNVDCVILDMGVPDHNAYTMLEEIKKNPGLEDLPIIVFTGKSLSKIEEQKIKAYADSIVVKTAHSYQRILDEVSIFLHLVENDKKQTGPKYKNPGALNEVLKDKKILIVDDDIRNIYSMTHALEQYKVNVITATDGREALQLLAQNPDTHIVLMDIMMPEMDGYEAIKKIRENKKHQSLPVIAVTAKAMLGDREKCMGAGASDYISKPVDIDQLLSLLRVWLYER
jgi:signal transduction histidine kinase/DNA-binding response OmpR family regulator/CHASE3 domain sensor protein